MKSIGLSLLLALLAAHSSSALDKVRGVHSAASAPLRRAPLRRLKKDDKGSSKKGLDENGFTPKGKKGPTKRDCDTKFKADTYEFKCSSKTEEGDTEIDDSIDYSVKKGKRGVEVNIKYEQKIKNDTSPGGAPSKDASPSDKKKEDPKKGDTQQENTSDGVAATNEPGAGGDTSVQSVQSNGDTRRQLDANQTATKTSYDIIFDRIVEYVPLEGSMAYSFDNEIVQNISLMDWGDFTDVFDGSNGDTSTFSITSMDGMSTFTFTISRAQLNESASANSMKIDFRLTNFPWVRNDTYVALITFFETARKVKVDRSGPVADGVVIDLPDPASNVTGLLPFGQLTWATTAEVPSGTGYSTETTQGSNSTRNLVDTTVDNTTDVAADNTTVIDNNTTMTDNTTVTEDGTATSNSTTTIEVIGTARTMEDNQTQEIAFSFVGSGAQGASDIFWDPQIGVDYADASADASAGQSSTSSFAFGLGFAAMSSIALLF